MLDINTYNSISNQRIALVVIVVIIIYRMIVNKNIIINNTKNHALN